MNLLKASLSGGGRTILIRLDQIATIQHECWMEKHYGDYKGYWTTKVTLISGKEVNISDDFDNIQRIWCESLGVTL